MKSQGSDVARDTGNKESALAILDTIIAKRSKITLQIQQEIVNDGKRVIDTSAGQQVEQDILRERAKHQREMEELHQDMRKAMEKNDAVARAHIAEIQKELQAKIAAGEEATMAMKADYAKMQKDRNEEMEKLRDQINEQVKQLHKKSQQCDELKGKLEKGQGDPVQLQHDIQAYEKRIEDLEKKMNEGKVTVERRKDGESKILRCME